MIGSVPDLVAFLREFHRSWPPPHGLDAAAVPGDLPEPLRLVYLEFGALVALPRGPFSRQDALYPVAKLKRASGLVEFACENQGNWRARARLAPGDPPVLTDADSPAYAAVGPLSAFLITLCLQEAMFSAPHSISSEHPVDRLFRETPSPVWRGHLASRESVYDFYAGPGFLVMDVEGFVFAGSHDEDLPARFRADASWESID